MDDDVRRAEYVTVGALLLDGRWLPEVAEWLRPEDFATPACGLVYERLLGVAAAGRPVDAVAVLDELRRRGELRRDGYPSTQMTQMVAAVPAVASVGYYGRMVLAAALSRQVQQVGARLDQLGTARRGDPEDLLAVATGQVAGLAAARQRWAAVTGRRSPLPDRIAAARRPLPHEPARRPAAERARAGRG